jgi:hypothetical protein
MFRQLAVWFRGPAGSDEQAARTVLELHPMELSRFLEEVWGKRAEPVRRPVPATPAALLSQEGVSGIEARLGTVVDDIYPPGGSRDAVWDHLIYAYMIENTRIYDIFRKVLVEFLSGERLGIATQPASQAWLRTTEELFFRDAPPFQIYSLTSHLRPDLGASRRNAYYRLFGMELNHAMPDGRGFEKPDAANRNFTAIFEDFLREVWRGIENVTNVAGARPTDDAALANLGLQLQDMLVTRRQSGTLSREEFVFVSMMSWFHLTVQIDSPIVVDLKATASSPEERLFKIGSRVGIPAHARSQSFFELAPALSRILIAIEAGQFNTVGAVPVLYTPGPGSTSNPAREDMNTIINHWSIATGRDMKARQVTVSPRMTTPAPMPASNGHRTQHIPSRA